MIYIWGGGVYTKILLSLFPTLLNYKICIIVDPQYSPDKLLLDYIAPLDQVSINSPSILDDSLIVGSHFIVAIGSHYGYERHIIYTSLINRGIVPIKLHHESSNLLNCAISTSSIVMPSVTVMPGTTIGDNTILNTSSTIDHDSFIGKGCHIMGSSYIAGCVKISDFTTIGSNSTIFPRVSIGYKLLYWSRSCCQA